MSGKSVVSLLRSFAVSLLPLCEDSVVDAIETLKEYGINESTVERVVRDMEEGVICSFMYAVRDDVLYVREATYYLMDILKEAENTLREVVRHRDIEKLKDLIANLTLKLLNMPRYGDYVKKEWKALQKLVEKEEKRESSWETE